MSSSLSSQKTAPTSTVDLPKQAFTGRGSCGQDEAHLVVMWGDNHYTLTLDVRRYVSHVVVAKTLSKEHVCRYCLQKGAQKVTQFIFTAGNMFAGMIIIFTAIKVRDCNFG